MKTLPQAFLITQPTTWQFRRAQSVGEPLSQAIRRICEQNERVRSCFLLDSREREGADTKLVIALLLDDETTFLRQTAAQFQDVLSGFPEIALKTAIMSALTFEKQFAGTEFYVRQRPTH